MAFYGITIVDNKWKSRYGIVVDNKQIMFLKCLQIELKLYFNIQSTFNPDW